jgi:hypothetical protein
MVRNPLWENNHGESLDNHDSFSIVTDSSDLPDENHFYNSFQSIQEWYGRNFLEENSSRSSRNSLESDSWFQWKCERNWWFNEVFHARVMSRHVSSLIVDGTVRFQPDSSANAAPARSHSLVDNSQEYKGILDIPWLYVQNQNIARSSCLYRHFLGHARFKSRLNVLTTPFLNWHRLCRQTLLSNLFSIVFQGWRSIKPVPNGQSPSSSRITGWHQVVSGVRCW